ncbi:MAG: transcriptional repressor [bacterium]|nr:transcriptional repressor [bacterium]
MEHALRKAGCRLTRQRRTILHHLSTREDHPTARQVYQALCRTNSTLSLATVYNTLNMLTEVGAIRHLDCASSDCRYDTNLDPHVNLVCSRCGGIEDFEYPLPVEFDEVFRSAGFQTKDARIEYHGVCAACSRTKAEVTAAES